MLTLRAWPLLQAVISIAHRRNMSQMSARNVLTGIKSVDMPNLRGWTLCFNCWEDTLLALRARLLPAKFRCHAMLVLHRGDLPKHFWIPVVPSVHTRQLQPKLWSYGMLRMRRRVQSSRDWFHRVHPGRWHCDAVLDPT